jgi:hypothetical protein
VQAPYATTLQRASAVLTTAFRRPVRLELVEEVHGWHGSPTLVLRCRPAEPAMLDGTATLVVKCYRRDSGASAVEYAGLRFLSMIREQLDAFPQPLAWDPAAPALIVMEDLGGTPRRLLGEILFDHSRAEAEAALTAFVGALARLHAATTQQHDLYQATLCSMGGAQASRHPVHQVLPALEGLEAVVRDQGLPALPAAAAAEAAEAHRLLAAPGPFLVLVHGDATPANALYHEGRIRLFDLEASGYRHAFLDGAFGPLRYLCSVWARDLPAEVRFQLLQSYRETLAATCPAARDEALFAGQMAAACAGWLALLLSWLPDLQLADRRWGRSSRRQRVCAGLAQFPEAARRLERLPRLSAWCQPALMHLRSRWPESNTALAPYPALTGSAP